MQEVHVTLRQALIDVQIGRVEEAKSAVSSVRESFEVSRSARLTVEAMIVEAACLMYAGKLDEGLDRFYRASRIAEGFGSAREKALASCWLSLIYFNLGRHLDAAKMITSQGSLSESADHLVNFRYACMLAMLAEYAGDRAGSLRWFCIARTEVAHTGEPRLLSPLLYNVAMLRVGNGVLSSVFPEVFVRDDRDELDLVLTKSSENYDAIVSVKCQTDLHRVVHAFAQASSGRFSAALATLDSISESSAEFAEANTARIALCRYWCDVELGREGLSDPEFEKLLRTLTDLDDITVAIQLRLRYAKRFSVPDVVQALEARLNLALSKLENLRREISSLLGRVEPFD